MAFLIKPMGETIEVKPQNGKVFGVSEMKEVLGMRQRDLIQYVNGQVARCVFVCDEEGKLKGLPVNHSCTHMGVLSMAIAPTDCFVGDILFFGDKELNELPNN